MSIFVVGAAVFTFALFFPSIEPATEALAAVAFVTAVAYGFARERWWGEHRRRCPESEAGFAETTNGNCGKARERDYPFSGVVRMAK